MRTARRACVIVCLAVLIHASPALAWNQVTHLYINESVWEDVAAQVPGAPPTQADGPASPPGDPEEFRRHFVFAGTYPDCFAFSEAGDHFHSPFPTTESSNMTNLPWAGSANFAAVYLDAVQTGEGYSAYDEATGAGIGCHIAADWVAHTLVPIAGWSLGVWHWYVETCADFYVHERLGYRPPRDYKVALDPRTARGAIISHAIIDTSRATGLDLDHIKLARSEWETVDSLDVTWSQYRTSLHPAVVSRMPPTWGRTQLPPSPTNCRRSALSPAGLTAATGTLSVPLLAERTPRGGRLSGGQGWSLMRAASSRSSWPHEGDTRSSYRHRPSATPTSCRRSSGPSSWPGRSLALSGSSAGGAGCQPARARGTGLQRG